MLENYTEDEKKRYITSQLGNEYLQKMENIHRGGNNASKGQHYEDQFMLFKVLEVQIINGLNIALHTKISIFLMIFVMKIL